MFQAVFPLIIRSSNYTYTIWYMSSLLAATASVVELPEIGRALTAVKNIV
jgi:hypothetical protein